jgi:uncharacterized damage-inducible protein DinB
VLSFPAMTISETLLPQFDHEMENTRKMLAGVPDGKWDWKPHAKSMSLGTLAGHIADISSWAVDTLKNDSLSLEPGDYKPYIPSSPADLVSRFEGKKAEARAILEKTNDEAMFHLWTMSWAGKKVVEMPRIAVLRGMILSHMIHHRGQLSVYLRLLDAPVPGMYGPSADEMGATGS